MLTSEHIVAPEGAVAESAPELGPVAEPRSEEETLPEPEGPPHGDAGEPGEECGPNLEYDPAFQAMEVASRGRPERQEGEEVIPSEEPDWRVLRDRAEDLRARTTDLRVLIHLACARTRLEGFEGLDETLELLRRSLEEHWDGVHPALDPDDDLDPTMRINVLRSLVDPDSMLRAVRLAPLAVSKLGRTCLRDVQDADEPRRESDEEVSAPTRAQIRAVFGASDVSELEARAAALQRCLASLADIETLLIERVGSGRAPDLEPLSSLLEDACAVLAPHLPDDPGAVGETVDGSGAPGAGGETNGAVRCREDVVRQLERICDYYARQEPSSPVPLLLGRAKRLVAKDFMHIIRDIAPEGVQQMQTIAGIEEDGQEEAEE